MLFDIFNGISTPKMIGYLKGSYITTAKSISTGKQFWLFEQSEELDSAIKKYKKISKRVV
ncbi:DUF5659 domain-containing protein [Tuberibacillus calidus]|uniref:DUF5659 domain-containing protein n=1 Tax=Tuberibacillus calidus TaxID=340097 RepID=UPI000484C06E